MVYNALAVVGLAALAPLANAAAPYCLPGASCFPSSSTLSAFNKTISGKLFAPKPYASVCYKGSYDAKACATLVSNGSDVNYRHELPAAMMYTNWEVAPNGASCPTPANATDAPLSGTCSEGAMAAYEVRAATAQDISASVKFAAKYNLRLRVKNTGHDYTGRSTDVGAFTVWTRNMKSIVYQKNFVASGCRTSGQNVVAAGPGADVDDLYAFAYKNKLTLIGGFVRSVGAAGGYIVGGGVGPFSTAYGMGVDNVVEYEVVTADGSIKTANACQNTDLFWALRGGGGAFGITTKVVIQAHPALAAVNTVYGAFIANNTDAFAKLVQAFWDLQPTLNAQGFNGVAEIAYPVVAGALSVPILAGGKVTKAEDVLAVFHNLSTIEGVQNGMQAAQFPTWYDAYNTAVASTLAAGAAAGVAMVDVSRVVSRAFLNDADARKNLAKFSAGLPANVPLLYNIVGNGAVVQVDEHATAINPAWRKAAGYISIPVGGPPPAVTASQNATAAKIANDMDDVFFLDGHPVAYYNEYSPSGARADANWQELFWGGNYDKLLAIKDAQDPKRVFSCRMCVGSEKGF